MAKAIVNVEPGQHSIFITRAFDAPRALVFKAHTDASMIPKWWGPSYLTTDVVTLEAKAGGRWRFVQRDKDGNVHGFHGVFHDLVEPESMVMTFEYEGAPGHVSLDSYTFEEHDGKTLLKCVSVFQSVEDRDAMIGAGMEGGMEGGFQRLDALLASQS